MPAHTGYGRGVARPQFRPKCVVARMERDGFIEENLSLRTTPHSVAPATMLIPTQGKRPFPGVVVLHDHARCYTWGHQKAVAGDHQHSALIQFKKHIIQAEVLRMNSSIKATPSSA